MTADSNLQRALVHVEKTAIVGIWPDGSALRAGDLLDLFRDVEVELCRVNQTANNEIARIASDHRRIVAEMIAAQKGPK